MNQYTQYQTTEQEHSNASDSSRSNYQVYPSSTPRLNDAPTLPHAPPQNLANTYPQPQQASAPSNMGGQSAGYQGYASTTSVFQQSQPTSVMGNGYQPGMNMPSYATMGRASFPTNPTPGNSPYGSSATSATNNVSGVGSSAQGYQASSTPGYSNQYPYPPSSATSAGQAGVSSLGTGQTSQTNESSGVPGQTYTNTYYNTGYYGYYVGN